jgi:hypothetical protein
LDISKVEDGEASTTTPPCGSQPTDFSSPEPSAREALSYCRILVTEGIRRQRFELAI